MEFMKDVMLDLETLGTSHDALIVQIGACVFDRMTGEIGETFKKTMSAPLASKEKFSVDYDTVKWWMNQSDAARASVMNGDTYLPEALIELKSFLWGDDTLVWSHATFDMPILQHAFGVFGIKELPYRNMRDLRTLVDLAKYTTRLERGGVHHDALDDAKFQAAYAADAFRKLYGTA